MKPEITITIEEARRIALRSQGLADISTPFGTGKAGALKAVEHLGYVQIDTISVIERAHHHVLWSRAPGYERQMLHTLQSEDRTVFEYWSHAASYLPMREYRYYLPTMRHYVRAKGHWFDASDELSRAMRRVLSRIRREGPLLLRDFESKVEVTAPGGWSSKLERRALHELWMQGKVMIRSRAGFQKIFDLPERVLPPLVADEAYPSEREVAEFRVRQSLKAHGIVREKDLGYLAKAASRKAIHAAAKRLAKRKEIIEVQVHGSNSVSCYTTEEALSQRSPLKEERIYILSPFDNLVIQRDRLKWLFGFDYQLECYVPAPKRKHGYFVLPILHGEQFVGRLDAKADREKAHFLIQSLSFESDATLSEQFQGELEKALEKFAQFNACGKVRRKG